MNYRVRFLILVLVCAVAASTMACLCAIPVEVVEKKPTPTPAPYVPPPPKQPWTIRQKVGMEIFWYLSAAELIILGVGIFFYLLLGKGGNLGMSLIGTPIVMVIPQMWLFYAAFAFLNYVCACVLVDSVLKNREAWDWIIRAF